MSKESIAHATTVYKRQKNGEWKILTRIMKISNTITTRKCYIESDGITIVSSGSSGACVISKFREPRKFLLNSNFKCPEIPQPLKRALVAGTGLPSVAGQCSRGGKNIKNDKRLQ